jgi:superfamily II DNA/RNA helicase
MYSVEEIGPILTNPDFKSDILWARTELLLSRLGFDQTEENGRIQRLVEFVNCILACAPDWKHNDGHDIVKLAAEIAELISIRSDVSPDFRKKMRIRSSFFYEFASLPALSSGILQNNDFDDLLFKIFTRKDTYGKLGLNGNFERILSSSSTEKITEQGIVNRILEADCLKLLEYEQGHSSIPENWFSSELIDLSANLNLGFNVTEFNAFKAIMQARVISSTRNNVDEKIYNTLSDIRFPSELWSNQISAIKSGLINEKYDSWGFASPTGTGKTYLARLLILKSLIDDPSSKIIYIVPSKALVNEVWSGLNAAFEPIQIKAVQVTPQLIELANDEKKILDDCSIAVLTPEKADLLLRLGDEFTTKVSLIIVDEAHHIEQGNRGILLELYLWRIKKMFKSQKRIIFLSAVTPNILELAEWMGKNPGGLVETNRSTRMRAGLYRIQKAGRLRRGFIEYFNESAIQIFDSKIPSGKQDQLIQLAEKIGHSGPILIVSKGKKGSEKLAKKMFLKLKELNNLKELSKEEFESDTFQRLDSRLEREMYSAIEMRNLIKYRIVYHHAGLPPRVRQSVEAAIRENMVDYVFATTTLAEGVNFPFSSVIVESLAIREFTEAGQPVSYHQISPRSFWNIAGRAGRPGCDQEGQVILFGPSLALDKVEATLESYLNTTQTSEEPVKSALADSIIDLFKGIENGTISSDNVNKISFGKSLPKKTRGTINLLRIGLIHAKASKLIDSPEEILIGTFATHNLSENENKFARELVKGQYILVNDFLTTTNAFSADLVAELGLSIETLMYLYDYVKNCNNFTLSQNHQVMFNGQINFKQLKYIIGPVAKRMAELEGDSLGGIYTGVIIDWLSGIPLLDVKRDPDYIERLEDLISIVYSRIQYLLPWGLYAMHKLVQEETNKRNIFYNDEILNLAYLVDAGVPNFDALLLVNNDFERVDATRLSNAFRKGGFNRHTNIKKWVNALSDSQIISIIKGVDNRRIDSDLDKILEKLRKL